MEALRLFSDAYLRPFVALGVIELDQRRENVRLTELGALLLPRSEKEPTPAQIKETAQQISTGRTNIPVCSEATWQREGQRLIIPFPASFPAIWQLAPFATLTKGGASIEFEIASATVASALTRHASILSLPFHLLKLPKTLMKKSRMTLYR